MMQLQNLIVIVGPTAVGKSSLGIEIAQKYNGEIISGDSMQVYRHLDIGTAKITKDEMNGIAHHMIDILSVTEDFSTAKFKDRAIPIIECINNNNKLPIIVGGTGLYIQSLIDNYNFISIDSSQEFREEKQQQLEKYGNEALYNELILVDSLAAQKIHPNDSKRIIRALEVFHITNGEKLSSISNKSASPYNLMFIGLTMDRGKLYEIINNRVDTMIEKGLIQEVEQLWELGLPKDSTAMQGIGYKELFPYITGEKQLEECVELLKRNTRRFAKRQLTWFRRDLRIEWFQVDQMDKLSLLEKIDKIIAGKF
jgi:tRNA dimethylallyltransferase